MIYIIQYMTKGNHIYQIVCNEVSLFFTTHILNGCEDVIQFKVSQGVMTCNEPREFGFGAMEKWVRQFVY
jgi:hypothetical protein